MEYRQVVRLLYYPAGHINEYALFLRRDGDGIRVSNMNMPYQGTLANEYIPNGEWEKV